MTKQIRLRVCGIYREDNKILLLKHRGIGKKGYLWSFPGGRAERETDLRQNLKREFVEETGLIVEIGPQRFVHEYIGLGLHAVEAFFLTDKIGGELKLGNDPEIGKNEQILEDIAFYSWEEIKATGLDYFHGIFQRVKDLDDLDDISGYFLTKDERYI